MRKPMDSDQLKRASEFCWKRAHKAATAEGRTFWFHWFDVTIELSHIIDGK